MFSTTQIWMPTKMSLSKYLTIYIIQLFIDITQDGIDEVSYYWIINSYVTGAFWECLKMYSLMLSK